MPTDPTPEEVEALRAEIARLQEELAAFHRAAEARAAVAKGAVGFGTRIFIGRRLVGAFKVWLQAQRAGERFPVDETAEVLAALTRRLIRVGIAGVILALLPGGLLIWHGILMRDQKIAMIDQNVAIRKQIEQQAADTLIVRRAQLLNTIYDCKEVEGSPASPTASSDAATQDPAVSGRFGPRLMFQMSPPKGPSCSPIANARARKEALLAFLAVERGRQATPDLSYADLSSLSLAQVNLSRSNLNSANLSRARLRKADLTKAFLIGADLTSADLREAFLTEADLFLADLGGADLGGADLTSADLRGADLGGADLRGADLSQAHLIQADLREGDLTMKTRNLSQEQIDSARGDSSTKLPSDLVRPPHWIATGPKPSPP